MKRVIVERNNITMSNEADCGGSKSGAEIKLKSPEASILNLKSIILRDTFERQEIFNKTSSIISDLNLENFKKIFSIECNNFNFDKRINEYENPDFSKNLCRIISSKISHINNYVWNKKF